MQKIINWVKENQIEAVLIVLILATAAFLRFYKISEFMTFLGDEGRDAIVVKALVTKGDIILIGPPTSIGNMYLGPIYYYMMAPFLVLSRLNPIGPAIMVALIGVTTVFLVYYIAREWFGKVAALTASALYALSPIIIIYSHSSWNPNPTPFFGIITIYSLYQLYLKGKIWWQIIGAGTLAAALQMHYLATLLIPTFLIFWFVGLLKFRKTNLKKYLISSLVSLFVFLLLMLPLFIFDLRHGFLNYKAFVKFFTERQTTVNLNPINFLFRLAPIYNDLFARFLTVKDQFLSVVVSVFTTLALALLLWRNYKNKNLSWPIYLIIVWVVFAVLGMSAYKLTVFDHYFGFVNTAPFLLFGLVISAVWQKNQIGKILSLIIVFGLIALNLSVSPIRYAPNKQLERTQKIAKIVISQTQSKPYNFALIAKNNYDAAYQYYLDLFGAKPAQVDFVQTDQLFVVCEDQICQPIGHPKSEIARFGFAKIARRWDISGVKLFKLVKNPAGIPQNQLPSEEEIAL